MPKERAGWEQVCPSCRTPREVIKKLYESAVENWEKSKQNPYNIDSALSDLSEIVRGLKKAYQNHHEDYDNGLDVGYNQAITDIAKLLRDKERAK